MTHWGYGISKDRQIDLDKADLQGISLVCLHEPSLLACISCGTCASACTAGISLRRAILWLNRGDYQRVMKETELCLLCGKCQLVCPRGVNTRNLVRIARKMCRTL